MIQYESPIKWTLDWMDLRLNSFGLGCIRYWDILGAWIRHPDFDMRWSWLQDGCRMAAGWRVMWSCQVEAESETNWTWIIRYPPDSQSCLLQWAENLRWFHLTLGSPSSPRIKIKSVQVSHSRKITGPLLTSLWSPWRYLMDIPVEPMPWFCAPRLSKRPGARHGGRLKTLNDLLRDRCDRWRCCTRFPISGLLGPGHEPCSKVQARNQNVLPLQGKLTWGWVKSYIILYYYYYHYVLLPYWGFLHIHKPAMT